MKRMVLSVGICAQAGALGAAGLPIEVDWTRTICADGRAVGWPSIARLRDGTLLAVFSGNRDGHICPHGVVKAVRSEDGGETWSEPVVIGETPIDDRDSAICQLPDGEILVSWFNSIAYVTHPYFRRIYGAAEKRPMEELAAMVDNWCVRSRDGGRTWSKPARMACTGSAPHGPIALRDGSLLLVGRAPAWRDSVAGFANAPTWVCCERSTDGGRSWTMLCDRIPVPEAEALQNGIYHEPHVAELNDGRLVALVRFHGPDGCFRRSESRDGGRTWTPLEKTSLAAGKSPPHLLSLPGGRLLCTYAIRRGDSGVGEFAAISEDGGLTWTGTEAMPLHRAAPGVWSGDIGYPATAALADGGFLTVFYEPEANGAKPSLRAVRWRCAGAHPRIRL